MAALDRAALRMGSAELLVRDRRAHRRRAGRDRRPGVPVLHRRRRAGSSTASSPASPARSAPTTPSTPTARTRRRSHADTSEPSTGSRSVDGVDHRPRRRHPALGPVALRRRPRSTSGCRPARSAAPRSRRTAWPGPWTGGSRSPSGARRSARRSPAPTASRRALVAETWAEAGWSIDDSRDRPRGRGPRAGAGGAAVQRQHQPARRPRAVGHRRRVRRGRRLGRPRCRQADEAAFEAAAVRASASPLDRCLFVDDTLGHVEAARALGMRAEVFTGPRSLCGRCSSSSGSGDGAGGAALPLPDPPLADGELLAAALARRATRPALVAAWADPEIARWTGVPDGATTSPPPGAGSTATPARRQRGLSLDLVIDVGGVVVGEVGLAGFDARAAHGRDRVVARPPTTGGRGLREPGRAPVRRLGRRRAVRRRPRRPLPPGQPRRRAPWPGRAGFERPGRRRPTEVWRSALGRRAGTVSRLTVKRVP